MKKNYFCYGLVIVLLASGFPVSVSAQKKGIYSETYISKGDTVALNYYVPSTYNPAKKSKLILYIGVINSANLVPNFLSSVHLDTVSSSPYFQNAIIVNPVLPSSIAPPLDTNLLTLALGSATSTYNINPEYIYISGIVVGIGTGLLIK